MTFEEQLARAFDTLTERLRGEIGQHVQRTSAELIAAAPYDRDPAVTEAARQELERAVSAVKRESDEALEASRREADKALAAARQESHDALAAAAQTFDEALAAARQESDAALAMTRQTWHEKGYAAGNAAGHAAALRDAAEANVSEPADDDLGRLADAMRAIDAARSLTEILDTLVTVASWTASGAEVWLMRGGQPHRWQPTGSDQGQAPAVRSEVGGAIEEAAGRNTIARDEQTLAVPIAVEGQVVAVFSANREPSTGHLELLVRYTAKCLEALTAFKTVRALTQRSGSAAVDASPVEAGVANAEEDTAARRYARLLISEIKLYHEPAVVDGRRDRDLTTRLGGEITRARVMYEQRVAPHVRARADYFQDELVRTLANGDASLLEVRT